MAVAGLFAGHQAALKCPLPKLLIQAVSIFDAMLAVWTAILTVIGILHLRP
jgi:hypothetical protein